MFCSVYMIVTCIVHRPPRIRWGSRSPDRAPLLLFPRTSGTCHMELVHGTRVVYCSHAQVGRATWNPCCVVFPCTSSSCHIWNPCCVLFPRTSGACHMEPVLCTVPTHKYFVPHGTRVVYCSHTSSTCHKEPLLCTVLTHK